MDMDRADDGFQMVRRKGKGRGRNAKEGHVSGTAEDAVGCDAGFDKSYIVRRLTECQSDLQCTEFMTCLKEQLSKHFPPSGTEGEDLELVCYGVGSFANCLIARYQLSLFLLMRDYLKVDHQQSFIYDPVLSEVEKDILKENHCNVIGSNEKFFHDDTIIIGKVLGMNPYFRNQWIRNHFSRLSDHNQCLWKDRFRCTRMEGKRPVQQKTIFYMPHCGKALYNNLLWANWAPQSLSKITIVGNSFHGMQTSTPERILQEEASYILNILPFTQEEMIKNNFQFGDIFNNTSIHTFQEKSLQEAPCSIWEERVTPVYDDSVEIICNKLS